MKNKDLDQKKIEEITIKAEGYIKMSNGLMVNAAFERAANEVLGKGNLSWGEYKNVAQGMYLNKQKEEERLLKEIRERDLLEGTVNAAEARGDIDLEENSDERDFEREGRRRIG